MRDGPLVLIHGTGCDSTVWSGQVNEFGGEREILLVDLPGRREEQMPSTSSFHELVDHTRGKLPAERALVVGHSLGAAVALNLALADEDRIAGVVLVGAAPNVTIPQLMADNAEHDFDNTLERLRRALFHRNSDPRLQELGLCVMRQVSPGALANDLRAASSFDFAASAHRLSIPVLLICGSHDRVMPEAASVKLQQLIGGHLEIIDGAGHMPMIEKSVEFNNILRAFLA